MFRHRGPPTLAAIRATLLGAALATCGGAGESGESRADTREAPREGETRFVGLELVRPIEVPAFTLADTNGEPYEFLAETSGSLSFLFFGFTHCPDVCPVQLANLTAVLGDLPYSERRLVEVVFITADPARDTPEAVRDWLDRIDRDVIGLIPTGEELEALTAALHLPPITRDTIPGTDDYMVGHPAQVMAITGDGRIRFAYPGGIRQADWRNDLPLLLELNVSLPGGQAGG